MISIKRFMDGQVDDVLSALLASYRSTLQAMGRTAAKTHPQSGSGISEKFEQLGRKLTKDADPAVIETAGREVGAVLEKWGTTVVATQQERVAEVQYILQMVANMAQSVAERDMRYGVQFSRIGETMLKIATLSEISEIRSALVENSASLKSCLAQMEDDGRESISRLQQELASYEARLESAEREATTDQLTRLWNRRAAERQLSYHEKLGKPFCMVILDLNRFKNVNDDYGHLVGDELLKQFADELRASIVTGETVARWGGDEFLVLMDGSLSQAENRARLILERISGDYTIQTAKSPIRIAVHSSVGIAEWDCAEPMSRLIERADASMYKHKASSRQLASAAAR